MIPANSRFQKAFLANDLPGVTAALREGADPNVLDGAGYPLLCVASAAGHVQMVDLLLAGGASPHLLDSRMGASALHKAAQSGMVQVAQSLLKRGAFIDLQAPTHGHTPLIDAVLHKKPGMVDYLIRAGATLSIAAHGMMAPSYTALDLARRRDDPAIVKLLEDAEAAFRARSLPPLHAAAKAGDEAAVRRLLTQGADPNEAAPVSGLPDDGHTPLHIAARDGHSGVAGVLIEFGARADVVDHFMRATPGHKAAVFGHTDILVLMAERAGLEIDAQGPYNGYTALHDAVWWGQPEAVRTLLALGANPDRRGLDGRSPREVAVADGRDACLAVFDSSAKS